VSETGRLTDDEFASVSKALADPRRTAILAEIARGSGTLACSGLSAATEVSAATISHHLRALEAAGLIEAERQGRYMMLSFRRERFEAYLAALKNVASGDAPC